MAEYSSRRAKEKRKQPLHDAGTEPWFREHNYNADESDIAYLSEGSELLYGRFCRIYWRKRCRLPADPARLAVMLRTTTRKAKLFLSEAEPFLRVEGGHVIHPALKEQFDYLVKQSIERAEIGAKGGRSSPSQRGHLREV